MALGTITKVTAAGVAESLVAPAASDSFAWPSTSPRAVWLEVDNASGGSINVTITSKAAASDGLAQDDKVVAVGAGVRSKIAISEAFLDAATGLVAVAFSSTTGVTANPFYL